MRPAKLTDSVQRGQILAAAEAEFAARGYHKTSMAAIAKACEISPAHLYNFFTGKTEIALELATQIGAAVSARVRRKTARVDGPVEEKIRAFLLFDLQETYSVLDKSPGLIDFFAIILEKHPEIANAFLATNRDALVEVLYQGIADGVLKLAEPQFTAECIQAATIKYRYPQWTSALTLRELELELTGLVHILLRGIMNTGDSH
ncbi:MAG: TetR/AcrR family transcriptional regulator [Pseudomonadota bacterium]